jgi:hypothetical protein
MKRRILRKRILRGLTLAFAIAIAIPVTNAAARPMSDSNVVYGAPVQSTAQSQAPIVSEKVAGLQLPVSNAGWYQSLKIRSEALDQQLQASNSNTYHLRKFHVYPTVSPTVSQKIEELGLPSKSEAVASNAGSSRVVSEKTAGLGLPSQPEVVSTPDSGFNWSDAGIGAGATTALLIAMFGGGLMLVRRRHHGTLAH